MVLFDLPVCPWLDFHTYRDAVILMRKMSEQKSWADKQVSRLYMLIKDIQMSKRKGKQNAESNDGRYQDAKEVIWCNIKTTDEDVAAFGEMDITPELIAVDILHLIGEGFSISVKRRDGGSTYQFTAICQDTASPNYGHGYSAFGDNPIDTIAFGLFKFYKIASRDLRDYAPTNTTKRRLY